MKVLITGASGQVGSALFRCAPPMAEVIQCVHEKLDIADQNSVAEYIRQHTPDVIINAAAYTAVDRAEAEPDAARRVNTDGPRNLARSAREVGSRLIHISTDFVFDGSSGAPYRPDSPTRPLGVYGETKRAGEVAVLECLPADRAVVLRTAWVYAAQGKNFVLTMLRLMSANGSVRVVSDQVGTPTSAQSLAETIWQIVGMPDVRGIHHWTDAGVASWYDFAVAIAEEAVQLGLLPREAAILPIGTEDYPTPARRPTYSVLDKTSLMSLGLSPMHWRKRLRRVLEEIKNG
jgi:dTDP-4-dehydrorhamnose reductase